MDKEVLMIGLKTITVEFEFRNESNQDIETEVAFPVPPYGLLDDEWKPRGTFSDFRAWIDGKEISYQTQDNATVGNKDATDVLHGAGIEIASFGKFFSDDPRVGENPDNQLLNLTDKQREPLEKAGVVDKSGMPLWRVVRFYHWKQVFPAGGTVRIKHVYAPVLGASQLPTDYLFSRAGSDEMTRAIRDQLREACLDRTSVAKPLPGHENIQLGRKQLAELGAKGGIDFLNWVRYILSSANTWKTPIKDFQLIIDSSSPWPEQEFTPNFCWDGPVERLDSTHLSARVRNFVPKHELVIYFLNRTIDKTRR